MGRPYAMLRAGFPYVKTVGMRRLTVNFPMDVALGKEGVLYILCRNEEGAMVRKLSLEDEDLGPLAPWAPRTGSSDGPFLLSLTGKRTSLFPTKPVIESPSSAPTGSSLASGGSTATETANSTPLRAWHSIQTKISTSPMP